MQFLAIHKTAITDAQLSQLQALVIGTRYGISVGNVKINQPAVTLCFSGPKDQADQGMIDEFRRICGE